MSKVVNEHIEQEGTERNVGISLDNIFSHIGFGPYQMLMFILAGLTALAFGFDLTVFSLIANSLHSEWGVNSLKFSIIPSVTEVPNILGGLLYGFWCDKYGRVWPYVVVMLNIAIFGLASAFSPNFVTFVCLRLFVAFGTTSSMIFYILLSQRSYQSVTEAKSWYLSCLFSLWVYVLVVDLPGG